MKDLDIHNFPGQYTNEIRRLEKAKIPETNKMLIMKFVDHCILENAGLPHRMSLIKRLMTFSENFMPIYFTKVTTEDLKSAVMKMEKQDYSPYYKQNFRAALKKFYKWFYQGDNYKQIPSYPDICSWINSGLKKKDQRLITYSDILTEEEIRKLIDASDNPRDKAFVSTLYELGTRISEHGNRRIKDVARDEYGYIFNINGKTGMRSPRIVMSASYLTAWLNVHPFKDDPEAPLWVIKGQYPKREWVHMKYSTIRNLMRNLLDKAKINKRIHAHLFRHSRATHCLANGWMNEAQCKVYFGWTPDSAMLSRYAHLTCEDANKAVLRMNGIEMGQRKDSVLKTKQCPNCKMINEPGAKFCNKCTYILDVKTATEIDETRKNADDRLTLILKEHPEIVKQIIDHLRLGKDEVVVN